MARVPQIDYETAPEAVKQAHDDHLKVGRMTNMKRTLLNNVPSFKALMEWYTLRDEAAKFLSPLDINLFCYAISAENDCLICSSFFRKILRDEGIDFDSFSFTQKQQALISFGRNMVDNPHEIDEEQFDEMKALFNDEQLVVLTAFGAIMIATNLINTVLRVDLDTYLFGYDK